MWTHAGLYWGLGAQPGLAALKRLCMHDLMPHPSSVRADVNRWHSHTYAAPDISRISVCRDEILRVEHPNETDLWGDRDAHEGAFFLCFRLV